MADDITTLDGKLRQRARRDFENSVKAAFDQFAATLRLMPPTQVPMGHVEVQALIWRKNPSQAMFMDDVLQIAQRTFVEACAAMVEQAAVDTFVADVAALRQQVSDLESRVG